MHDNQTRGIEELVPRSRAAAEYNISHRTACRWEKAGLAGFDDPVIINGHVYHRRSRLEAAKIGRNANAEAL
jgi:hypothetical protein